MMLNQTILTVEFYHMSDELMNSREPANVEDFDAAFRCEDFRHVEVKTKELDEDTFVT